MIQKIICLCLRLSLRIYACPNTKMTLLMPRPDYNKLKNFVPKEILSYITVIDACPRLRSFDRARYAQIKGKKFPIELVRYGNVIAFNDIQARTPIGIKQLIREGIVK